MNKRMTKMLIYLAILFGAIFGYKAIGALMFKRYMAEQVQISTVSTIKAEYSNWQPLLTYYASLRAIKGVNVTTELAGLVENIYFTPGANVTQGTVLVQLNADTEIGQLNSLKASEALAQVTYDRDKAQYAIQAVSKQTLDSDAANLKNFQAQVAQQAATVAKKTIRAPFTGKLGISAINPGQYLNTGDTIVPLQELDYIYVDFYVPQQDLVQLKIGLPVKLTVDTYPGKNFEGKITTINPVIDSTSRNVEVEATVHNPDYLLVPGMFGTVNITTGKIQRYITLPQAAISYNSFGDIVYIVNQNGVDKKGKPILTVEQSFVTLGDTRGDQVAVLQGVKEGDLIVTAGQLKLKNGSRVEINNTVVPENNPTPKAPNEY